MLTATTEPKVKLGQLGVGDVNVASARRLNVWKIPNPNAALDQFVGAAADGTAVFNSAAWASAAHASAAWADAAWSDAAWSSAAWSSAAWASAAWSDAAWASAAWGSAAWSDAAWSDAAWADAAWADGAEGETVSTTADDPVSALDQSSMLAQLGSSIPTAIRRSRRARRSARPARHLRHCRNEQRFYPDVRTGPGNGARFAVTGHPIRRDRNGPKGGCLLPEPPIRSVHGSAATSP